MTFTERRRVFYKTDLILEYAGRVYAKDSTCYNLSTMQLISSFFFMQPQKSLNKRILMLNGEKKLKTKNNNKMHKCFNATKYITLHTTKHLIVRTV